MKDKILQGLKQSYANLGLSDEILEGQASTLATFATEENMATLIEGQKAVLTAIQSSGDKYRGELSNLRKQLEDAKKDKGNPQEQPTNTEPKETNEQYKALMDMFNSKFEEIKQGYESKISEIQGQTLIEKRNADFQKTLEGIDPIIANALKSNFELNKSASDEDYNKFLESHVSQVTELKTKENLFAPSSGQRNYNPSNEPTQKGIEEKIKNKKTV